LGPDDSSPWNDTVDYRWRFPIRLVSDQPVGAVTWTEVQRAAGRSLSIQSGWCAVREQDVELALRRFFAEDEVSRAYRDDERRAELEALGYDMREFDIRAIARRQGQPAFRRELLRAYGERCAVTGSRTADVLEAALISPYLGQHTNVVTNGLLLRSDIHTLFDLQRLTVLPDLTVLLHPELRQGDYQRYHRRALAVKPADQKFVPDAELLREHNHRCDWVTTT
jgi:hypothetical protein